VVSPVSSPGMLLMLPGCGAGACRGVDAVGGAVVHDPEHPAVLLYGSRVMTCSTSWENGAIPVVCWSRKTGRW
jgi:hypothetical protein